jgi:hypothetical protein
MEAFDGVFVLPLRTIIHIWAKIVLYLTVLFLVNKALSTAEIFTNVFAYSIQNPKIPR